MISGIGFDPAGRLYVVDPGDCRAPGKVSRISADDTPERVVAVGICPFGIDFAEVPEEDG